MAVGDICPHLLAFACLSISMQNEASTPSLRVASDAKLTQYSGRSRISPRRGCQLPRGGNNIRFRQNFLKTA